MKKKPKCEICRVCPRVGTLMCVPCARSYDRHFARTGGLYDTVKWAARRTWRFANAKHRTEPVEVKSRTQATRPEEAHVTTPESRLIQKGYAVLDEDGNLDDDYEDNFR